MGLLDTPPTRPRTYDETTPVDPNDLNEIFDAIIQLLTGIIDGDLVVDGNINATGDVTAVNGVFWFGGMEKMPLSTMLAGEQGGAAHTLSASQIIFAASANTVKVPIVGLVVGAKVWGYKAWIKKGTSDVSEFNIDLVRSINGGADEFIAGFQTSSGDDSPGDVTIEVPDDQEHFIESGYQYWLLLQPPNSVAPAADRYYNAEVHWSKPAP